MATFRGKPACSCLIAWLPIFEAELLRRGVIRWNIDIAQLIGGAPASGGTHSTGGAFDVWQRDTVTVQVAREMGAAAWSRTRAQGFDPHTHGVLNGCPHNSPARYQIAALAAGYNGLGKGGRGGKDSGPMPRKLRTWQQGIAWAKAQQPPVFKPVTYYVNVPRAYGRTGTDIDNTILTSLAFGKPLTIRGTKTVHGSEWGYTVYQGQKRWWILRYLTKTKPAPVVLKPMTLRPMSYNLPGSDKLPDPAGRVKAAVALIKSGTPGVVGLQELIGPGVDLGTASTFAKSLDVAMGAGWTLITPTTAHNENYALLNDAKTTLIKQYPDTKLYAKSGGGGRHITRMALKDETSGRVFAFGVTHLHDGPSMEPVRQEQAVLAMKAMKVISELNGDCPIVIVGDMNTGSQLAGFIDGGLQNVMIGAAESTNAAYATYATIGDDTPNLGKPIDQLYASKAFTMNGYTVLLGLDSSGTWPSLKPSDHVPVLGSITLK